jgi:hypothetical protein
MKKFTSCIFLFFVLLGCSSCCSTLEKQTKALSMVSFAIRDSIEIGRFDLADEYSKELVRLVHPPAKQDRIIVQSLP